MVIGTLGAAAPAGAQGTRLIDRADCADRLHALWLGECVAQRTGVRSEGRVTTPPFLTDTDWNTNPPGFPPYAFLDYWIYVDPWTGDDDTEIEYVYVTLMEERQTGLLSSLEIADGWLSYINYDIFVSDLTAKNLMLRGIRPPATAMAQGLASGTPTTTDFARMIDAQLTTEVFGIVNPGMPERALAMADMPIRTTSTSFATHAAQFYVAIYALASQVDRTMPVKDQCVWLVREARKFIPDTSKAADVIDFVLAEYLANPDRDDWETTRDRVYLRYQAIGPWNPGFIYQAWYESPINLAQGLICFLFGEMDFKRTVRIGTLCGWDSDNGTATFGALAAYMLGYNGLRAQFPGWPASDRYLPVNNDTLPDRVPADPAVFDTFTLWSQRMLPIIDRNVTEAGGRVSLAGGPGSAGQWLLPPGGAGPGLSATQALASSPTRQEYLRSANNQVRAAGGTVIAACSATGSPPDGQGSGNPAVFANGYESDWRGLETDGSGHKFFSTFGGGGTPGATQTLTVTYDRPVSVHTIRFTEGDHFAGGGWVDVLLVQTHVGGAWTSPGFSQSEPLNAGTAFQVIDCVLNAPVQADAIRLTGVLGAGGFLTCMELDALSPPMTPALPSFDRNADGRIDAEDLYCWCQSPADLNRDGTADAADGEYLRAALRWGEGGSMTAGRR